MMFLIGHPFQTLEKIQYHALSLLQKALQNRRSLLSEYGPCLVGGVC
jgi:hypothetical protein